MSFDLKLANGDIVFSSLGELQTVEGIDKLTQDIVKMLLTTIGSNPYHEWYGSLLTEDVVGLYGDIRTLQRNAESTISEALENMAALQAQQKSYQNVTAQESIGAITNVSVERDPTDPRQWIVRVSVLSKSLSEVTEEFNIAF